jgi:hypothetical protein
MKKTKLECTSDQLHDIHVAADKVRKNSKTVKVDRAALTALLIDHQRLVGLHRHELDGVL